MRFRSTKQVRWYVGLSILLMLLTTGWWAGPRQLRSWTLDTPVRWLANLTAQGRTWWQNWTAELDARTTLPRLQNEVDLLKTRVGLLEAENNSLRRALNFPDKQNWRPLGAEVIARTSDATGQTVIINRGAVDGLVPNLVAVAENGVLIGQLIAVRPHESVVRLLNDNSSRVAAILAKNGHPVGIVEGGYGLGVRLSLIPPQEAVVSGDLVVTGDAVAEIPRGLLVGKVTSVGRETYEPFQHALLEPALSYDGVRALVILLP